MAILREAVVPLGRPLFIPKEDGLTLEDIIVEASGGYLLIEKPDHFIVKNDHSCKSIKVVVKTKD